MNSALSVHDDDPVPAPTVDPDEGALAEPPPEPAPAAEPLADDPEPVRDRLVDVELAVARRFDDVDEELPEALPVDPERDREDDESLDVREAPLERDDPLDCEAPLERDDRDREELPEVADPDRDVERRLLDPLALDRDELAEPESAVAAESLSASSSLRHALGSGMPEVRLAT